MQEHLTALTCNPFSSKLTPCGNRLDTMVTLAMSVSKADAGETIFDEAVTKRTLQARSLAFDTVSTTYASHVAFTGIHEAYAPTRSQKVVNVKFGVDFSLGVLSFRR